MANVLGRHSLRLDKLDTGKVMYFPFEFETLLALQTGHIEVE